MSTDKAPPIIAITDVWFSYHTQTVLREVNLSIHAGDFLAVIGPNGGGKTTLIKLMLGLLKPERGQVSVFGRPPREVSPRVGYVPQEIGFKRGFPITIEDVVAMGNLGQTRRRIGYPRPMRIQVEEALHKVEMWEYRHRRIDELSGGQRQRVFIARALVSSPEVLFLDEPTASIDMAGQTDFYSLLKGLNQDVTIVVVSHDFMALSSYVKSVACVNERVFYHEGAELTQEMLDHAYACPVELIAHGLPHRVFMHHNEE